MLPQYPELLNRLELVSEKGAGKFKARCPAHDDRTPSLEIKFCGDGKTLIYCHAGCETEDVLASVGMTFADLMPKGNYRAGFKNYSDSTKSRKWITSPDALKTLGHELMVIGIIAADISERKEVSEATFDRLATAISRIDAFRNKIGMRL